MYIARILTREAELKPSLPSKPCALPSSGPPLVQENRALRARTARVLRAWKADEECVIKEREKKKKENTD